MPRMISILKKCYGCGLVKFKAEFNIHNGRKDGRQTRCRVCTNFCY